MADADAARELRAEVVANGGHLELGVRDLRDWFKRSFFDDAARNEVSAALDAVSLRVEPRLEQTRLRDQVVVSSVRNAAGPRAGLPSRPPATNAGEQESDVAIGVTAAVGAASTAIGFFVFGLLGGLLMLVAGVSLVFFVAGTEWSARRAFATSACGLLLLGFVIASPLGGDDEQRDPKRGSAPLAESRTTYLVAVRQQAERSMDTGDYDRAIRIADGNLDDQSLGRVFRQRAAREVLRRAEGVLFESPRRAQRLARRSARYQPSADADAVAGRAADLISTERGIAESPPSMTDGESASDQPVPEPEPSQESEEPTDTGGGESGCLSQSACPGKRDGDGDGCYCEG